MACHLICASHGPALVRPFPKPAVHEEVARAYAARAAELQRFDPELIILFAPDHYSAVQLHLVPPFTLALACEAAADYGGFPGRLNVSDLAQSCLHYLRAQDFDIAASHHLVVDHGFSQPLYRLAGGLDRYPVIPILIETACQPVPSYRRVRLLGEAVGRFALALGKRVAIMASGGLSHHPVNLYPPGLADAQPQVQEYMMFGGSRGAMHRDGWLDFLAQATELGGQRVARGEIGAADLRINPEWDGEFLRLFAAGDFAAFDRWSPHWVIEQAGVGATEVQNWIAAGAAAMVAKTTAPKIDFYAPVVEYRIAVGLAHADGNPARDAQV